jgi:hypothetical protein
MKPPIVIERDEVERAMHACNLLAAQRASLLRKIEGGAVVEDGSLRLGLSQLIVPVPQFVFDPANTPRRETSIARLLDGSDVAFLRGRGYRDAARVRRRENLAEFRTAVRTLEERAVRAVAECRSRLERGDDWSNMPALVELDAAMRKNLLRLRIAAVLYWIRLSAGQLASDAAESLDRSLAAVREMSAAARVIPIRG